MQGLEKQDNAASEDLAQQLAVRARELSLDTTKDSPFALLAKGESTVSAAVVHHCIHTHTHTTKSTYTASTR